MPFLLYISDICLVLLGYKAKIWPVKYTCIQSPMAMPAAHSKAAILLFVIHCLLLPPFALGPCSVVYSSLAIILLRKRKLVALL